MTSRTPDATTSRPTFEFSAFAELLASIAPHLDAPQTVSIDLSRPRFFGPGGMVPLVALIDHYTLQGWEFLVELPTDEWLYSYFKKAGWLAAITGEETPVLESRATFTPLHSYADHSGLNSQINLMMDVVAKVSEFESGVLTAVEWVVNEIADNVLVHAGGVPGWVQVIARPSKNQVEIAVADCGIGILGTMSEGFPELTTDEGALGLAIERGVTRNKAIGQGNGLAGSIRIAEEARGWVNIMSGSANLRLFDDGRFASIATARYPGTIVTITLPTSVRIDLGAALWGYQPSAAFEFSHVTDEGILFELQTEATGFGNRGSGLELAMKLRNIMTESPEERVVIDFAGVDVASASFLDEFLAKMIKSEGVTSFFSRFQFRNMNEFVRQTADAVIAQRLGTE